MFDRKRIARLELENEKLREQIVQLYAQIAQLCDDWNTDVQQTVHAQIQQAFQASLTSLQADMNQMAKETIERVLPCRHDIENATLIAVQTFPIPSGNPRLFGNLIDFNNNGDITTNTATCFIWRHINDDKVLVVFAKRCNTCGNLSSVNWFDIAAAGSSIEWRNIRDLDKLSSYTPIVSPATTSALDKAIRGT